MNFSEFEQRALEYWEEIPETYKSGIDGVRVQRRTKAHDDLPEVYTLGECVTETYPSDFGGPDTIRSAVVLYHGSFAALAHVDDEFDWEEELWETLTHELQHHLESLAGEDALEDVDYAADENFKRFEGEPFDPLFYRAGSALTPEQLPVLTVDGVAIALSGWRVEADWFVELTWAQRPPAGVAALEWPGSRHAFELPAASADVTFVVLGEGFEPPARADGRIDELSIVLVRRRSGWRAVLGAFGAGGRERSVEEFVVDVSSGSRP